MKFYNKDNSNTIDIFFLNFMIIKKQTFDYLFMNYLNSFHFLSNDLNLNSNDVFMINFDIKYKTI